MAKDIRAMRKGGNDFYFINKETSADSVRGNNSKNSHRMAFDTARRTKTETSKLKNVISASFKPLSLTIPIGDGFHESFHSSHCYL